MSARKAGPGAIARITLLAALILILAAAMAGAGGSVETGGRIRLEGRIRVVGNMPLVKVVISGPDSGDYILEGPLAEELAGLHQLEQVVIVGRLVAEADGAGKAVVEVTRFRVRGKPEGEG